MTKPTFREILLGVNFVRDRYVPAFVFGKINELRAIQDIRERLRRRQSGLDDAIRELASLERKWIGLLQEQYPPLEVGSRVQLLVDAKNRRTYQGAEAGAIGVIQEAPRRGPTWPDVPIYKVETRSGVFRVARTDLKHVPVVFQFDVGDAVESTVSLRRCDTGGPVEPGHRGEIVARRSGESPGMCAMHVNWGPRGKTWVYSHRLRAYEPHALTSGDLVTSEDGIEEHGVEAGALGVVRDVTGWGDVEVFWCAARVSLLGTGHGLALFEEAS